MAQGTTYSGGLATGAGRISTNPSDNYRDFIAIEYSLSGRIAILFAAGEVQVGNPGIEAVLNYAIPQGSNPTTLLLDLALIQRPGVWPDVQTWASAKYMRVAMKPGEYDEVQIVNQDLGNLTVKVVHLP